MAAGRAGPPPLPAVLRLGPSPLGTCWPRFLSWPSHCLPRRETGTLVAERAFLEDLLPATPSPGCSDSPGHGPRLVTFGFRTVLERPGLLCSHDGRSAPAMTRSLGGALWSCFKLSRAPTVCSSFEVTCYIWRLRKAFLDILLLSVLGGIQFCLCLASYFQRPLVRLRSTPVETCFYILETSQASSSLSVDLIPSGEHARCILLMKSSQNSNPKKKCLWA